MKSIYYESIALCTKKKIQQLKHHLAVINEENRETRILQQFPMTKRLCIDDRHLKESPQLTEKEFLYLLSLFPNLKSLDVVQSLHRHHYLKILSDCPLKRMSRLHEIVMNRDYIWEMTSDYLLDYDESLFIQQFMACYQFRQSLKRLTVACFHRCVHGKRLMELLPDFQNLSTLEVHNHTNPDTTFFHLLHTMPSLSSLTYMTTLETSRNESQQLENLKCEQSSNPQLLDNLTKVKISLFSLTTTYIDFFTNYSPRNLTNVEICSIGRAMHVWIKDVSPEIARNFFKSLRKCTSLTLTFGEDFDYTMDMVREEFDSFNQVLDVLTEERDFRTLSVVHADCDGLDNQSSELQICIAGSKLSYKYRFVCMNDDDDDDDDSAPAEELTCLLPSEAVSRKLANVNKFKIDIESEDNNDFEYYLDYAKKHLPKLKHFHFNDVYNDLSLHVESLYKYQPLHNITRISLYRFLEYQQVTAIAPNYFSNIGVLSFNFYCLLASHIGDMTVNLADYKCLHTLIFDVGEPPLYVFGPILLRYVDHNKSLTYHTIELIEQNGEMELGINAISTDSMQSTTKSDEKSHKFEQTIDIEGPEQLKTIRMARYDANYVATYTSIEL